jgi:16S rRNA (cytidine1402-2'-O)-methyltransferase
LGVLVLCPTPIGNLEDITLRALRCLREADVVFCEDTRRTQILLRHHGIARPLRSYHKWNESQREQEILTLLRAGMTVALCSDAGSPGLSDPGEQMVAAAVADGHRVEALPGPQAVIPALTASGLPTSHFYFEGFLPKRVDARRRRLQELACIAATLIFYESPRRLQATVGDMIEVFGHRRAALVRELSKAHEEIRRGTLDELGRSLAPGVKGECVLVVAGAEERIGSAEEFVADMLARGFDPRTIVKHGVSLGYARNEIYSLLFHKRA